jgi:quinoprotein glucose dehydrogenase
MYRLDEGARGTSAPRRSSGRGISFWRSSKPGEASRIFLITPGFQLVALDAHTGRPVPSFGNDGRVDLEDGLPRVTELPKTPPGSSSPPVIVGDVVVVGVAFSAGGAPPSKVAVPGWVRAYDAHTGALKWSFHTVPQAGDFGVDTWLDNSWQYTGNTGLWTPFSADAARGYVYLPIEAATGDFYGGHRHGDNLFSDTLVCIEANTGRRIWHYQIVHHDIWDYDTNSAPTLVDLHKDGKTIPALVQSSKMGFFFVLNRLTGEPVYPIPEHPVPKSDVPGEQASPTQPWPETLEPTVPDQFPGIFQLADWASFGECSREFAKLRHDGRYTPPSIQGSIAYPSTAGGVEWGGGAVDPRSDVYVVNSSAVAQIYRLVPRDKYDQEKKSDPKSYYPQKGSPYGFYLHNFVNRFGMPCWNPPYGTMSAYDLNTGKLLWRKPFGEVQKWGFYMPDSWGSVTIGGPLITKSGVVFAGGSMDARVRAIDLKTGDVLWKAQVDAPAVANPGTYVYKGRQYVVFVAGGNAILKPQVSDQVVAYALPTKSG